MQKIPGTCITMAIFFMLAGSLGAADLSDLKLTPMRMNGDQFRSWAERRQKAPKARINPDIAKGLFEAKANGKSTSVDLLQYLEYTPSERKQGKCGNCWVWSSTGLYEIWLSVNKATKDRLSIQYLTSCKAYDTAERCACCGGDLGTFTSWYNSQGKAIPWSNTNASYVDGPRTCSGADVCAATAVSCDSIAKDPSYPVDKFQAEVIPTTGLGSQETAIANIKSVLNEKRAVEYSFALANSTDWDAFENFWYNSDESVLWNPDKYCGKQYDSVTGCAHATVLVGYNDDDPDPKKHYWVILDSNGDAGGKRPNGVFRIPMYMNYDCKLKQGSAYNYVTHFEVLGKKEGNSLSLNLKGTGGGRVTSNPPGIDCRTSDKNCTTNFDDDVSEVTLTAIPDSNSTFKGWSGGGCSGTGTTCTVVLDDDVEIEDEFDTDCTYKIFPEKKIMTAKGGSFNIVARAYDGDNCPSPQIVNDTPWIKTDESAFTNNRGTVKVTVDPKETPGGRQGSIKIADKTLPVDQAGVVCKLGALNPPGKVIPSAGGEGYTFTVQTQPGCPWEATVNGADWITVDSGKSGIGTGEVTYSVTAGEPGKRRSGRINVTLTGEIRQKRIFTVIQDRR